jgi:hypothetical protein
MIQKAAWRLNLQGQGLDKASELETWVDLKTIQDQTN